jgi:hypothetical protein
VFNAFIKYQQALLDYAVIDLHTMSWASALGNLFDQSLFKTEDALQF